MVKQLLLAGVGVFAIATAAAAAGSAVTTGDLNIRSGPGTGFSVVGVIPAGSPIAVKGCVIGSSWCAIQFAGNEGWSNAGWLSPSGAALAATWGVRDYRAQDLAAFSYAGRTSPMMTRPGVYASTNFAPAWRPNMAGGRYTYGVVNGQGVLYDTWSGRYYLRTD